MKKIFITREIPSIAEEMLSPRFLLEVNRKKNLSKEGLIKAVGENDVILSTLADKIDEEVLSHAKNLKVISNYAVGLDNIDVEYAKSKGIKVFNLPDIVTRSTAELTFAILLSLIRKICDARDFVKNGLWKNVDPSLFIGEELFGKTFGIIGFGRIGKAVARIALGFGLKVVFYHHRDIELENDLAECKRVSEEELLESSDYISLTVPLNESTRYLVDMDFIKKMKKKPVLINVARGAVVNSDHLAEALQSGLLRAAALDVTDPEPISNDHVLCKLDNCLIVPHIGTATADCRFKMAKKAAENILSFFF